MIIICEMHLQFIQCFTSGHSRLATAAKKTLLNSKNQLSANTNTKKYSKEQKNNILHPPGIEPGASALTLMGSADFTTKPL
jgi:hypothetical protein